MVWNGLTGNGLDPVYRAALTGPHVIYSRVDITDNTGAVLISDLRVSAASVSATLNNRVARKLTFTTTRDYFPVTAAGALDPSGNLAPYGNRVLAYRGIQYGDGSSCYFPVFTGRLDDCAMNRDGTVTVTASDLAAEVVDGAFETPASSNPALIVPDQFKLLVSGAVANATFGTFDTFSAYMPVLLWQNDRAKACDDVAAAVGGIWYPLADGRFVLRQVPWTKAGQSAVVSISDQAGGILSDFRVRISRVGVYSSVVFTSERTDAGPPQSATVRDDVSTSPTYYRGRFGLKPLLIQNQAGFNSAQAYAAAQVQLRSSKALTQVWENVTVVPDPSLELGDVVAMTADGVASLQVISGFALDLLGATPMPLQLRTYTSS